MGKIVEEYIDQNISNSILNPSEVECYYYDDSVIMESNTIKDIILDEGKIKDPYLVYTRSNKGELIVFYIFGEVKFNILENEYCNYLCLKVPTISGSSFINTSLYGFLDLENFRANLQTCDTYIVSQNRVMENHL